MEPRPPLSRARTCCPYLFLAVRVWPNSVEQRAAAYYIVERCFDIEVEVGWMRVKPKKGRENLVGGEGYAWVGAV